MYGWAIDNREKSVTYSAYTLSSCMHLVLTVIKVNPLDGFAWTFHSLRTCAIPAAYAIGVNVQKIKYFGGWGRESSVVLVYI
jgi:hypothetical protein